VARRASCFSVLLAGVLSAFSGGLAFAGFAGTDVFLPSIGRKAGAASSQWYTTVWIHNPSSSAATVRIYFMERGVPSLTPVHVNDTVPAGDTRRYANIVEDVFHVQKFGALRFVSATPILVTCRMYNLPPGGEDKDTQGQDSPGIPASLAIGAGESTTLLGVYQTAPKDDSQFRYNFGWVETTGGTANVRVTPFAEDGSPAGPAKDFPPTGAYEPRYYAIEDLLPINATNLRLKVEVTGGTGKIVATGAGVANRSNDATTFEMQFADTALDGGGAFTLPYSGTVSSSSTAFFVTNSGSGTAIQGSASGGYGVFGMTNGASAATAGGNMGSGPGVQGTSQGGPGVRASSASGLGVYATTSTGLAAIHGAVTGLNQIGVWGLSTGGYGIGGGSTNNFGVYGESVNSVGIAGAGNGVGAGVRAISYGSGDILEGMRATTRVFRVDRNGKGYFNGGTQTGGADVAEFIDASTALGPGDVVEIDPLNPGKFRLAATAHSSAVAGVVSTDPGVTMNFTDAAAVAGRDGPRLALTGLVAVKVCAQNGVIRPGDLLVASSTPGHAMRAPASPAPGTVIGKALGSLDAGAGVIEMLVMLR